MTLWVMSICLYLAELGLSDRGPVSDRLIQDRQGMLDILRPLTTNTDSFQIFSLAEIFWVKIEYEQAYPVKKYSSWIGGKWNDYFSY